MSKDNQRKRTKEWFLHKLMIFEKMAPSKGIKLTATKGWRPDLNHDIKQERIDNLKAEAKKRGIKL